MTSSELPASDRRDSPEVQQEIEKKFLITSIPENLETFPHQDITQGYAYIGNDGTEIRLRQKDGKYFLTAKAGSGEVRIEQEQEISEQEFQHLWATTEHRRLEKTRYNIPHGKQTIELDVYRGDLQGLVTAEVEFSDPDMAMKFIPPDWFGDDVTEQQEYKNQSLAISGRPGETSERKIPGNPEYDKDQGIEIATSLIKMKQAELDRPVVVLLAGGSASGKTSAVGRHLAEALGQDAVPEGAEEMLSVDHYYRGGAFMAEQEQLGNKLNFDQPEAVDLPLVAEHLQKLREGQAIERPVYSFKGGGTRTGTSTFAAREVVIAEGLFTLDKQLADLGDVKIYVDIGTHGQFLRRIMRDVTRTDWTPQQIMDYFATTVAPMHEKYVASTKDNADIVIRNEYRPIEEADRAGMYEQQLKFPGELSAEKLRKLGAQRLSRTTQNDHYLNPHDRELTSSDEMLRIRDEGETKILTYKGPKKPDSQVRTRPKFEFEIDADMESRFLKIYGDEFETIQKERTIYQVGNILLSTDQVKTIKSGEEKDLGIWTEIRFQGDESPETIEQTIRDLGLDPAEARRDSYIEM